MISYFLFSYYFILLHPQNQNYTLMKKLLLVSAAFFFGTYAFSQSQRLVLFEEFTSENCPPCAATNPGVNALLNANSTKVVSIKYQNDIPSPGPMYYHNTVDVEARQTVYANNYSPNGILDGNVYNDQPATLTQTTISNRYAVASPFTITVSHYLSPAHDSIYAHATITCSQAVSATMVAHMVVIERNIYFTTAPGSNGEKTFEGVMKKMLPTSSGTSMAASQTVGLVTNLDYSWKLANVYDTNQLAVVAFVQNTSTKEVYQAGYSRTHIQNDAGITAVTGTSSVTCNGNVTPTVTIYNYGISTLTSATITSRIDAGPITNTPWTGSIASGSSAQFTLPLMSVSAGSHVLTFATTAPNALTDLDTHNDTKTANVTVLSTVVGTPLAEAFTAATYPPTNWSRENVDGDAYQWARVTAGNPSYSSKMDFYNATSGTIDNLYTPLINFTNAISGAQLTFDVSHAQYSASYSDRLKVNISTNCGATWTTIYNKAGATLASHVGYVTTAYTPTVVGDWRNEVVSLSAYAGQANILLQFSGISGYGNNVYVDNINITDGTTGINLLNNSIEGVNIYPNPSRGEFNVNVNFNQPQNLSLIVTNNLGAVVKTIEMKNVSSDIIPLNMTGEAKGTYVVTIKTDSEVITKRISVIE